MGTEVKFREAELQAGGPLATNLYSENSLASGARSKANSVLTVIAVLGLLSYGYFLMHNAPSAVGGSDSSGYANAARSVWTGKIVESITALDRLGLPDDFDFVFIQLAYVPGPRPRTMVPFYPLGLPLHMAAAALITGWERGPFLVSPLAALLSLVLIYLAGRELGLSRGFSMVGAAMLAACPTFLNQALQAMSDMTATCWALAAIFAALRSRRHAAWSLLAGASFGMAFLVRPTNVLLLAPILLFFRSKPRAILFFLLGGLPLAGVFFAYNAVAFGHPFQTGYGSIHLADAVTPDNFIVRFRHYVYWLAVTMSPLPLLGWLGVAVDRKVPRGERELVVAWFGSFLLFYACYDIYGSWEDLRYLLPGIPAMILGALLVVRDAVEWCRARVEWPGVMKLRWAAGAILLIVTLGFAQQKIRDFQVLDFVAAQSIHPAACQWADLVIPDHTLVVAVEMSGALKFYTDRPIIRWDWVEGDRWQLLRQRAAEHGYRWYALLLPYEVEEAQKRLKGNWEKLDDLRGIGLWRIEPAP